MLAHRLVSQKTKFDYQSFINNFSKEFHQWVAGHTSGCDLVTDKVVEPANAHNYNHNISLNRSHEQ